MEETIIKCDYCESLLNDKVLCKNFYIELREKNKKVLIDKKYHFCDRHCLSAYLAHQHEDKGE